MCIGNFICEACSLFDKNLDNSMQERLRKPCYIQDANSPCIVTNVLAASYSFGGVTSIHDAYQVSVSNAQVT